MPALRPMREDDVAAVHAIAVAADDLADRFGSAARPAARPSGRRPHPPPPPARLGPGRLLGGRAGRRGGGARPSRSGARACGASRCSSSDPAAQSGGLGSVLLRRASAYGDGARCRMILSSHDPRALRAYARLGLALQPCLRARGHAPRRRAAARGARRGPCGHPAHRAGATVRSAGRPMARTSAASSTWALRLLVVPDRGYVVLRENGLRLLAAHGRRRAPRPVRAVLARAPGEVDVEWLTERQAWAFHGASTRAWSCGRSPPARSSRRRRDRSHFRRISRRARFSSQTDVCVESPGPRGEPLTWQRHPAP